MILTKKTMAYYRLLLLIIFSGCYSLTLMGAESCALDIMYGVSAREGRRIDFRNLTKEQNFMEDRHTVKNQEGLHFFGVYDGHGGSGAAEYTATHLAENFFKAQGETIGERLDHAFLKTDKNFLEDPKFTGDGSGTTAVVAVIDSYTNKIVIANCGDSRGILTYKYNEKAVGTTQDHKPNLPEERERIAKAGGFVYDGRVNGNLAVSRAIGDRGLKKSGVISTPDTYEGLVCKDNILVLACDGLWDVMTNEEVVAFVHEQFNKEEIQKRVVEYREEVKFLEGNNRRAKLIAESLVGKAYEKGSRDNISVLIVKFKPSSWTTRLFKLIGDKKGIILSLGVVAIFYSLYHYRFL